MITSLVLAAASAINIAAAHPAALAATTAPYVERDIEDSQHAGWDKLAADSTVFTTRNAKDSLSELADIYCPSKKCIKARDWLTMQPKAAAGWAIGSLAFLAGGLIFRLRDSFTCYPMIELGISLFLRAGLNYDHGNKRSIYVASLIFHYSCANTLFANLVQASLSLKAVFEDSASARPVFAWLVTSILGLTNFAMIIAGSVIMFQEKTLEGDTTGLHLIQAVLYIMIIVMGLSMLVLLKGMFSGSGSRAIASFVILSAIILVALWASFMLSRTYLPLTNVTRSSEVAWYCLGVLPLGIIGIIF
ncbi:hypothetical protein EV183_002614 [Coemansia sp. RSA 2336]|nr:hypothetical protein EV183_002614 [Coemansia sp. RSA 2336]